MKPFSPLGMLPVLLFAATAGAINQRTIVDMAGRTVIIPAKVSSVYSTSPQGEILMYTLNPDKITGMTWTPDDAEKKFLVPGYLAKPVLGGWFGKNTTGNPEVIIKARPDIVLSAGFLDRTDISATRRIAEKLGIPVVMVDGTLESLDSTYRFLGTITGEAERADTLARYCRNAINSVKETVARIPVDKRPRVYYAEGITGLETDSRGSMHTEVLDMAGGINVAEVPAIRGYGRATASFEQILVWKPQTVLVCLDHGFAHGTENYDNITNSPSWRTIDAVKNGSVYLIPSVPFNCFDRPPSVNRIFGLLWLSNLLYPDYFKTDIRKETLQFYRLFYHRSLTENEIDEILYRSLRTPGK